MILSYREDNHSTDFSCKVNHVWCDVMIQYPFSPSPCKCEWPAVFTGIRHFGLSLLHSTSQEEEEKVLPTLTFWASRCISLKTRWGGRRLLEPDERKPIGFFMFSSCFAVSFSTVVPSLLNLVKKLSFSIAKSQSKSFQNWRNSGSNTRPKYTEFVGVLTFFLKLPRRNLWPSQHWWCH